jgi:hypothetical protein
MIEAIVVIGLVAVLALLDIPLELTRIRKSCSDVKKKHPTISRA